MNGKEQKEIEQLHNQIDGLQDKLNRVLFILESDGKTNQKGLVERQGVIEDKLTKLLIREEIYKAKGTVWGIVGGALATVIFWAGKLIVTKVM